MLRGWSVSSGQPFDGRVWIDADRVSECSGRADSDQVVISEQRLHGQEGWRPVDDVGVATLAGWPVAFDGFDFCRGFFHLKFEIGKNSPRAVNPKVGIGD